MGTTDENLVKKIQYLKNKKNVIILAHYYQSPEIQDAADAVGDTVELCRIANESKAETVLVCGVDFVAETVSLMCPEKTVLVPDPNATCPMAGMITSERLREKKKQNPGAKIICYLKSPAEVKAESDICCTSENAVDIVREFSKANEIIFVPDQYLGDYVCTETGVDVTLWPGYCPSHFKITLEDIQKQKKSHPQAKIVVHPECSPQVRVMADAVLGTSEIFKFVGQSDAREFIVGTETGVLHHLSKLLFPAKVFIAATERAICGKMRLNTLESVLWSLENMNYEVKIPQEVRTKARAAIDRMKEFERQRASKIK